jgi:hypothetical protein
MKRIEQEKRINDFVLKMKQFEEATNRSLTQLDKLDDDNVYASKPNVDPTMFKYLQFKEMVDKNSQMRQSKDSNIGQLRTSTSMAVAM